MKLELEEKLAKDFPFMRRNEDNNKEMIDDLYSAFGCECGDGWYQLLYDLCGELTEL
jgi:hypothetical protein